MDGFKVGSARIYQLFSNASGESSLKKESSASVSQQTVQTPVENNDAVRLSPAAQQEQAAKQSKLQELKQKVQSGEYQKQLKSPTTLSQIAKSVVEFYSA